jgi:hypothetical protein
MHSSKIPLPILAQGAFTIITGDIGSSPGIMPPNEPVGATLIGTNHGSDAYSASAQIDANAVRLNLTSLVTNSIPNELVGVTLLPGVYTAATFLLSAGELKFDALNASNSTFILVTPGYALFSGLSTMVLLNGARPSRIFWAIGDYASFAA